MAFLHPFTKESRIILTSIVRMAKELGIHTLAEGVETKEQADFLRDIGCEKLQGYYFGKPLPLEECLPFCQDRDLSFESLQEAVLLNRAGLIDVSQSSPVAIVADDSQNVQFLQINDAYLKSLQSIGTKNVTDSNLFLRSRNFPMHQKFRHFADKARKSGQPETMTYVDNGQYMQVTLKTVAQAGQRCIHQAELYNISLDEAARDKQSRRFDNLLRNILLTYEGIWYLDMERRVLEIIEPLTSDQQVGETNPNMDSTFRHFAEYFVHPKDRERFLHFTDWNQFYQQAAASENGMITEPFRILRSNGNFDWFMIIGMVLPKSPSQDILFFITKPPFDDPKKLRPLLWEMLRSYGITAEDLASDTANMSHALWQTFLQHSREKVIWKDRFHRIGGTSQAFVEWLGIPEKELLGKTTQELGFCVDCQVDDETDEKAMCTGQAVSGCLLHFVVKHLPTWCGPTNSQSIRMTK